MSNEIRNLIKRVGGLRVIDYIGNKYVYKRNIMAAGGPLIEGLIEKEQQKIDQLVEKNGIAAIYDAAIDDVTNKLTSKGITLSDDQANIINELSSKAIRLEKQTIDSIKRIIPNKFEGVPMKKVYDLVPDMSLSKKRNDFIKNLENVETYFNTNFTDKEIPELEGGMKGGKILFALDEAYQLLHQGYLELYEYDSYPPFIAEDDVNSRKIVKLKNGKYVTSQFNQFLYDFELKPADEHHEGDA